MEHREYNEHDDKEQTFAKRFERFFADEVM